MNNQDWYIEIIDCRGRGSKTGQGASWPNEAEARASFEAARPLGVPSGRAEFLIDLHSVNGDLIDTISTDAAGFEAITRITPETPQVYDFYDTRYWQRAKSKRLQTDKEQT